MDVFREAKAMVFWGEENKKVLAYLRENGISPEESKYMIQSLIAIRHDYIRKKGKWKMHLAILCAIGCYGILLPFFIKEPGFLLFMFVYCSIIYGFFRGLHQWLWPHRTRGDISVAGILNRWDP